jgi:hypothetical protein
VERRRGDAYRYGIKAWAFYIGVAFLFTHELDAVFNHEWRVLPFLETLPDDVGMLAFIAGHVPLFAVFLALIASPDQRKRQRTQLVLSTFLPIHGLAHGIYLYIERPGHEFSSPLSNVLIFGGALCGVLYLMIPAKATVDIFPS